MNALTKALVVVAIGAAIGFGLTGCDSGMRDDGGQDGENTAPVANITLRSVPSPASTGASPTVLYSTTDGEKNYYVIDIGSIKNAYISSFIDTVHYNGATPIAVSRTDVTETSITRTVTEIVSESITVTDATEKETEIGADAGIPFKVLNLNLSFKHTWAESHSESLVSAKSVETSVSEAQTVGKSTSIGFTIGGHGERSGWYRYAIYATVDVYLLVTTSLDNQTLLESETVVCARDDYKPYFEYSTDGDFDNSPVKGGEIEISDTFYKALSAPALPSDVLYCSVGGELLIPSNINKVVLTGGAPNANIIVQSRAADLNITLNNATIAAPAGKAALNAKGLGAGCALTISISGSNTITGGAGGNAGIDAGEREVRFIGAGNLTVSGGAGNAGARGADNDDGDRKKRRGGDGGTGGDGLICFSLAVPNDSTVVVIRGGRGGNGGDGGKSTTDWWSLVGSTRDGGHGGAGGPGGSAVTASVNKPVIPRLTLNGGAGGSGGSGASQTPTMWGDGWNGESGATGSSGDIWRVR